MSLVAGLWWDEALYGAAQQGDVAQMKSLIERGADVNSDFEGDPVLSAAVQSRNVGAVKLLLDHGADPNSKGTSEQKPVVELARYLPEIRALLIKAGAKT